MDSISANNFESERLRIVCAAVGVVQLVSRHRLELAPLDQGGQDDKCLCPGHDLARTPSLAHAK